jgi:death on curing protein
MSFRPLSLREAEFVAHALATELMDYVGEPIPPFNTRSPGRLESCLAEPFQTFGGQNLHPTFVRKAAVLFYLCIKNHPFENGNKRMAVVLTTVFCYVNKRWLTIDNKALYDIACLIAESKPAEKDEMIAALEVGFKNTIMPVSRARRLFTNANGRQDQPSAEANLEI